MKNFLGIFVISFILSYIFLSLGGILIFESFWGMIVFVAFIITILIMLFMNQETKIEELETRIKTLESEFKPKK